jgi:hypothetical protein
MLKQAYAVLDELKARQGNRVAEAGPDVMRHRGDRTVKIVKRAGKPIGEIGIDAEASEGNGPYYVKLYDGSYDAVGYDSAEEALAELRAAVKQMSETMAEGEGMSRAAKGYEKYGRAGMAALAKAGREGRALDPVRDKYDRYDEGSEADVAEGRAGVDDRDTVGFSVNSEAAYNAVMARFGDAIDLDETLGIMSAPARIWPQIEMTAFDADPDSGAVRVEDDVMEDIEESVDPVEQLRADIRRFAR